MSNIQLLVTQNQTGLSAFKAAVWNPLDFVGRKHDEAEVELDEDYLTELEQQIVPILERLEARVTNRRAKMPTVGYEVGDDKADLSYSTINLGRSLVYQEKIYKMKTSWKDTFISNRGFNFCEVTSPIPASPHESMDYARKVDSLAHLGFSDAPVLRLIGNVQKGDRSHSSSATGKASMVARRLQTPRTSNRAVLMLACFLQDGCLNTSKSDEPKYLDGTMGGSGCPPLWDNPANAYLYVKAYKNGVYSRVYGTAINELRTAVEHLDAGRPASAPFCERLREKQEYLHITYAQNVMIPPRTLQKDSEEADDTPKPLYTSAGSRAFVQAAERRLVAAKRLITRTQAEVEIMRTKRIVETVLGLLTVSEQERFSGLKRREKTERFEFALRANTAAQKLLERCADGNEVATLIREGFLHVGTGVRDISLEDVYWLSRGGTGEVYTIHDVTRSEDMFIRLEVSSDESMKVPGILLITRMSGAQEPLVRATKAKVGLWEVTEATEEWADKCVDQLRTLRDAGLTPGPREVLHVLSKNREWVSDDSILIELARQWTDGKPVGTLMLISADIRLGRHISKATGFHVVIVHPESVIKHILRETWTALSEIKVEDVNGLLRTGYLEGAIPEAQQIFVDTGSLSAFAMRLESVQNAFGRNTGALQKTTLVYSDYTAEGRIAKYQTILVDRNEPFRAKIIAANGTERNVTIGRSLQQPQQPGPLRSRMLKMTRLWKQRR
jgi:hypothetical protein